MAILIIHFDTDAVAAGAESCNHCGASATEWIEDRVVDKRKHPDQVEGEFKRKRSWMGLGRGA